VYALRFLTLDVSYHELSGYWGGPDEWRQLHAAVAGSAARPFHPLRAVALATSLALALAAVIGGMAAAVRRRSLSPWGAAFVGALLANTALMGVAGKQVFGHYVTNLFPFVVVAWAALCARCAAASLRARAAATVAVVIVAVGGVEATWSVSRRVDARIGLAVHRCAARRILDDAVVRDEHCARLDFRGLRSSGYDWQVFLAGVMDPTFRLDARARARFVLQPAEAPRPRDADDADTGGTDCGAARLWRLR